MRYSGARAKGYWNVTGPEQKRRVFVVDDERAICHTLAVILNRRGFAATAFEYPLAALAAAESSEPELLISDVMMPGMTGIDLAIELRQHHPNCKVLLFSGMAETNDLLVQARAHGYDFELLTKPIHPEDLLSKLQAM